MLVISPIRASNVCPGRTTFGAIQDRTGKGDNCAECPEFTLDHAEYAKSDVLLPDTCSCFKTGIKCEHAVRGAMPLLVQCWWLTPFKHIPRIPWLSFRSTGGGLATEMRLPMVLGVRGGPCFNCLSPFKQ